MAGRYTVRRASIDSRHATLRGTASTYHRACMQLIDGRPVYSATDLVGFLECEHLTNLDRAAVAGLVTKPIRQNDEIDLIAKRGLEHEQRIPGAAPGARA